MLVECARSLHKRAASRRTVYGAYGYDRPRGIISLDELDLYPFPGFRNPIKKWPLPLKTTKVRNKPNEFIENSTNTVKINEKRATMKSLMLTLPCIALSFGVENIITQPSEQRRSFVDWGAFHVEPSHLYNLKNYNNH